VGGWWKRAAIAVAPIAFFVLRILGNQLEEKAVDRQAPASQFAADVLDRAELFSVGAFLSGLAGLVLFWYMWVLRARMRVGEADTKRPAEIAWAAGAIWALLVVFASLLAATAPVLADFYRNAEGARLFATLEFPAAPLGLMLFGLFALGNGVAALRGRILPPWLAWIGIVVGLGLFILSLVQPFAEPTASRSDENPDSVVTVITGLLSFALVPLWLVATGIWLSVQGGGGDRNRPV
jgi:hypothetical protein